MKKHLKIVEAFAGYGSQRIALQNLGHTISNDSMIIEWCADAIIANAAINHPAMFLSMINNVTNIGLSKEELINHMLKNYRLSSEKKKVDGEYVLLDKVQYNRWSREKLIQLYSACRVTRNLGSILDVKGGWIEGVDLFTYSFPCQDLSIAGKMKGITKESRSGLLYQVERILKELPFEQRPKILLMENVKNLIGKRFMPDFQEWLDVLETLGYHTNWQVLNAKHLGVPQNRERVFALSIRNDISDNNSINHPYLIKIKSIPLETKLKDYLESEVDETFYLSDDHIKRILGWNAYEKPLKKVLTPESLDIGTITTRSGGDTSSQKLVIDNIPDRVGNVSESGHIQGGSVYSINGIAPTFTENHSQVMKIVEKENLNEFVLRLAKQHKTEDLIILKEGVYHFVLSDGSTRKIGYREKEQNWLLPISRTYTSNIVGGEIIPTLMTSARTIVVPTKIDIEEILNGKKLIMGINETSHGENYYISTLRAGGSTQLVAVLESYYNDNKELFDNKDLENTTNYVYPKNEKTNFHNSQYKRIYYDESISPTILTNQQPVISIPDDFSKYVTYLRIRKITPREALRLMGLDDARIDNLFKHVITKSAQYKLAGNSIVIPVLENIFKEVLGE